MTGEFRTEGQHILIVYVQVYTQNLLAVCMNQNPRFGKSRDFKATTFIPVDTSRELPKGSRKVQTECR